MTEPVPAPTSLAPKSSRFRLLRRIVIWGTFLVPVIALGMLVLNWQRRTRDLKITTDKAYAIHRLLINHATAHGGQLVSLTAEGNPLANSNDAFNAILDPATDVEIFYLPGNAWHGGRQPAGGHGPLKSGDNAWAYIHGLNLSTSGGNLPVLAPGFDDMAPGFYHRDAIRPGGLSKKALVVVLRLDGTARPLEVDGAGRILELVGGKPIDIFSIAYGTNPKNILNPSR